MTPGRLPSDFGKKIDVFVIDEAHCISQWGYDFRPSYLDLAQAIRQLGRLPVLALTATASREVAEDLVQQLQLEDVAIINTGIYRENPTTARRPSRTSPTANSASSTSFTTQKGPALCTPPP